jgi:hypothetical protein
VMFSSDVRCVSRVNRLDTGKVRARWLVQLAANATNTTSTLFDDGTREETRPPTCCQVIGRREHDSQVRDDRRKDTPIGLFIGTSSRRRATREETQTTCSSTTTATKPSPPRSFVLRLSS